MLARNLELRLDPAAIMEHAGIPPDSWRVRLLRSRNERTLLLCSRQSGKSTVTAAMALHEVVFHPKSLVLLLSPSLRQSQELFRKVTDFRNRLGEPIAIAEESALRVELRNGSRIVALPGTEGTVRSSRTLRRSSRSPFPLATSSSTTSIRSRILSSEVRRRVDLGQTADYTAITILEEREKNSYDVRYLERLRNTPYPAIVRRLDHLVKRLPEKPSMAVDATGVGRPVIDMIRDANLPATVYAITLTGGDAVIRDGLERRVPKRDVASTIAVLLQTGRLRIARGLKESETLLRELLNFRAKISLSGHDSYEAWREQEHDDLVLAVGLAAWLFEKGRDGWVVYVEEELARMKREKVG